MALLPKFVTRAPKRSNFDLTNRVRTDMPVGLLVPLRYDDTLPADQFKIQVSALLKSFPTLAPVMGAFKLQIDFFFCPWRNYLPEVLQNDRKLDLRNIGLPFFMDTAFAGDQTTLNTAAPVAKNSLWDYLGFPVGYTSAVAANPSGKGVMFSALPFLMYYDIYRNYYINQQEDSFYGYGIFGNGVTQDVPAPYATNVNRIPLEWLDSLFDRVLSGDKDFSDVFGRTAVTSNEHCVLRWAKYYGLCCRTYMPDQFTTILNSQKIETIKQATTINVENDAITMDQLITARKGYRFLNNSAVAGTRYGEQIRAHFGVRTDDKLNIPQFLGSTSMRMTFDDVVSTSNDNTGDPDSLTGLGARGGNGTVFGRNSNQYVNCTEYGTIMCIASIVPIVDYFQGISKFSMKTSFTDVFFPEFDGLGYQDIMKSELLAIPAVTDGGIIDSSSDLNNFNTAIGKQPAWLEYMTKDNRVHGEFTDTLRYWTLTRDYARWQGDGDPERLANFFPSSYVMPQDYNYLFSDTSNDSNFQLQVAFDVLAKRPISKQLTPTL